MGQDSRWLERLVEFEFAINRPSTRETSQKRWRVISFPMDGRRSTGEACGSDDIVPGYHDGNVLDTGSSTWLNRWSDRVAEAPTGRSWHLFGREVGQRRRKKTKERNLRCWSCGRQLVEPVWKNDFGERPPILDKTVDTNPLSPNNVDLESRVELIVI